MQWDWHSRNLKLSVGELSRFSLMAVADDRAGRWRMEIGSHWHQVLRDRAAGEPGWVFEESVAGSLSQGGWMFELRGRIDQFRPGEDPVLREIKTTSRSLPSAEDELRQAYPHYFHQAMIYAFLLGRNGEFPVTELVFLEIQTGITQTVVLGEEDLDRLHAHLQQVISVLEERQNHFGRLRNYEVPLPFPEWRPGQPEARHDLGVALESATVALFEAPTGFGKTGIALEQGLRQLAAGDVDRILLLTGKNTGHGPLLKQLEAFRQEGHQLAIHALRSRKDLALAPGIEATLSYQEIAAAWRDSGLSAPALLEEGIHGPDDLKALGQQFGIPPWAISRMLLPYADIWIADFNYLFDPTVSQVIESVPTFDPARTFLVIDEAHNLPDRVAASHSFVLEEEQVRQLLSEIHFAHYPGKMVRLVDQLLSTIKRQPPAEALDPATEGDLLGLLREIRTGLQEVVFLEDELSAESMDWLWNLRNLLETWDHPHLPMVAYSQKKGRIQLACLDASAVISPVIGNYFQTVLMSATLQPWDSFLAETGLAGNRRSASVVGRAPWLESAFEVMVDTRVDTRYRQRDQHLGTTASAIGETALTGKGCTVAFFPSYLYAEKVLERLRFNYPALRCVLQPGDLPLEEQTDFLESALMFQDILLLVLGSRFSEGIDTLGGKVGQAIVVSPALPEVNSVQRAREGRASGTRDMAFRSVYLIPGIRKVSQALGRLVRSPGQSARVLLHGRRFAQLEYSALLPSYLQPADFIQSDQDFDKKWLNPPHAE